MTDYRLTDIGYGHDYYWTFVVLAFTDHLGSILAVFDTQNERPFAATYDAWGNQTVQTNAIGLHRGYTGHEMLPEFGIINMNGRLYDPLLDRFLSPDNYVQLPGNSQSYNRYSYCLNNPLRYTDPSGQLFGIDDALIAFTVFSVGNSMIQAAGNGKNIWKAGALSLLGSAASFGIGQALGSVGNFGHELLRAGAHGISGGLLSTLGGGSFASGFASGASSSGIGSLMNGVTMNSGLKMLSATAIGGISAFAVGGDFLSGALRGLSIALFNHSVHVDTEHLYKTKQGNLIGYLEELEVVAPSRVVVEEDMPSSTEVNIDDVIGVANFINTAANTIGLSLENNSGNSTVGTNGKFYFKTSDQRGFYGNQYVKTIKLRNLGSLLSKATGSVGIAIGIYDIKSAYQEDMRILQEQGYTDYYNTNKAIASFVCGGIGGALGVEVGGFVGSAAGPAGSIALGAGLGIYGSQKGAEVGVFLVNWIYGK